MKSTTYTREQLIQKASLTPEDMAEVMRCRREYNRLGFAYQIGFVRLFNRLPEQQPLEIDEELLQFAAMQLGSQACRIEEYATRSILFQIIKHVSGRIWSSVPLGRNR